MKRKKILFTPIDKAVDSVLSIPKPSANHVPEWYKNQKLFSNVTNNFIDAYKLPDFFGTYKACVPFVDTLTSGYTITLDSDVIFTNGTNRGYLPKPSWMGPIPPLDNPDNNKIRSIGNYPVPVGYTPILFRWFSRWIINTPKDYSLLIMHPSHRHDLPFFTINGLVDTDKHENPLNFPFFIKTGFEGIIEKGTPIAQIIPIKRDSWESEKGVYDENTNRNSFYKLKRYAVRSYRQQWWTKKSYR
jgi:hypothetical protein